MTPLRPCVHGRAACVLVVDDETDNTEVLEIILTWEGVGVMTAHSGEVALALVAQSAPDLIMLDVMMPGIDGYEVATRLKADLSTTHIPIIIFTAMAQREREGARKGERSGRDSVQAPRSPPSSWDEYGPCSARPTRTTRRPSPSAREDVLKGRVPSEPANRRTLDPGIQRCGRSVE